MGGLKILYLRREGQPSTRMCSKNHTSGDNFVSKQEKLHVLNKLLLWNEVIKSLKGVGAEIDQVFEVVSFFFFETFYNVFVTTYCLGNCLIPVAMDTTCTLMALPMCLPSKVWDSCIQSHPQYIPLDTVGIAGKHVYLHHSCSFRMPAVVVDVTPFSFRPPCLSWTTAFSFLLHSRLMSSFFPHG